MNNLLITSQTRMSKFTRLILIYINVVQDIKLINFLSMYFKCILIYNLT